MIVVFATLILCASMSYAFTGDNAAADNTGISDQGHTGRSVGSKGSKSDLDGKDSLSGKSSPAKTSNKVFRSVRPEVKASVRKDYNHITWSSVPGAKYYKVYRSKSAKGRYTLLGKTRKCSYNDKKADSGQVYYYKVRAFKTSKVRSKYSRAARIRTVYRVYIACGHGTNARGKWDPGCTYDGLQEARLMLPITKDFVKYMRQAGVYVYTDADTGNNMNLIKCVKFANGKRLSAYISIHCDWQHSESGTYPLYRSGRDRKLATALNSSVTDAIGIPTRGLCRRTDLRELNDTDAVSCIFETGSIKYDNKIFTKQHNAYGRALAKGLCEYLGVKAIGL